jgi:hypothetical protein
MQRYYDAHLYLANWGTRRIMLRLPRALLDPKIARQYCVDGQVSISSIRDYVILDLTSEDETGEWVEGAEDSLAAIVGVRSELAAGDLRPLYLAWLSGYGAWERDEDAFGDEDEEEMEPPVPAGLGSLTAPQRALVDFLRLDSGLLEVAAEVSPALPAVKSDVRALAAHIAREDRRRTPGRCSDTPPAAVWADTERLISTRSTMTPPRSAASAVSPALARSALATAAASSRRSLLAAQSLRRL